MAGDFSAGGVPDGEELGGEGGGAGHAAVVAAELDEEEDEDAEEGADGGDVEQVLDVAVPGGVIGAIAGGRRRRESIVHGGPSEKGSGKVTNPWYMGTRIWASFGGNGSN